MTQAAEARTDVVDIEGAAAIDDAGMEPGPDVDSIAGGGRRRRRAGAQATAVAIAGDGRCDIPAAAER